ncbi:MAG: DUF2314 domain-containing protein [Microvirga sp.]
MRVWLVAAVAAIGMLALALSKPGTFGEASSLETKARKDLTVSVVKGDPSMLAAREKGRATLDHFLSVNENRPPNSRAYSVKIPVEDGGKVEWFWISNFGRDGDRFWGHIDNTPRVVANVRQGQRIDFQRADIADWTYVRDGRIKGNFTACAMMAKESEEARKEFARKFRMDCSV